jgi:hypothetical protein
MENSLQLVSHKHALLKEIEFLKTQLAPQDTGHIRTAIHVLEERVEDIDQFLDDVNTKSKFLMEGIAKWDTIMSKPGNL